jgi:hypothetical protein
MTPAFIHRIAADQAEKDLPAVIGGDGGQPRRDGGVFFRGKRVGIDLGQPHAAAGLRRDGAQHPAHPGAIGANGGILRGFRPGEIEVQLHRFIQAVQDPHRAGREPVKAALGQIQTHAVKMAAHGPIKADKADQDRAEHGEKKGAPAHRPTPRRPSIKRMAAARPAPIRLAK